METQTEFSVDVDSPAYLLACQRVVNHKDQPMFVLLAQDASASLAVRFWVRAQIRIQEHMDAGLTMTEAVKAVETYYFLRPIHTVNDKQRDAMDIADAMEAYSNPKLAD